MLDKSYSLPTLMYGCEIYANCDYYDKYKLFEWLSDYLCRVDEFLLNVLPGPFLSLKVQYLLLKCNRNYLLIKLN